MKLWSNAGNREKIIEIEESESLLQSQTKRSLECYCCCFCGVVLAMDEDQIEGCVSGYLKQKGFTQNDDQLQLTNTDSSLQPDTLNRAQYFLFLYFVSIFVQFRFFNFNPFAYENYYVF